MQTLNFTNARDIKHSNRSILLYPIVFLYIFNITPAALPIPSVSIVTIGVLVSICLSINARSRVLSLLTENLVKILLLLAIGSYGTILSLIWGPGEFISLQIFAKSIVVIFCAAGLVGMIYNSNTYQENRQHDAVREVLEVFYRVCFFQATIVVITFLIPEFRDEISGLLVSRGNIDENHLFRFRGLHDSGGFTLTSTMGIAAVYGFFSCITHSTRSIFLRLASTLMIVLSIAFIGRTGFIVIAAGLLLLAIRWTTPAFTAVSLLSILVATAIAIIFLIFPERFEFFSDFVFDYAFEFAINFFIHGEFSSTSSDDLATMLFLPEPWNIVFGSGSFDEPSVGVDRSDSGYMKTMLTFGVFGAIFVYGIYLTAAINIIRKIGADKDLQYLCITLFSLLFFIEIKGPVFYQNDLSRLFWLIFCASQMLPRKTYYNLKDPHNDQPK